MKTNFIDKYIRMFTTSIFRVGKKETIVCKNNSYILVLEIYFSNCQKIKSPIQVLRSGLKKNNYINFAFETNANNS
jgi:hypothetical protein